MKPGLNILVSIYERVQDTDDIIGGSRQHLAPKITNLPGRVTEVSSPYIMKAQGLTVEGIYQAVVESPNYQALDIQVDDVLIPEQGQYTGIKFMIMEVSDTSLDDNPIDYRGFHKGMTLKRFTPQQTASLV